MNFDLFFDKALLIAIALGTTWFLEIAFAFVLAWVTVRGKWGWSGWSLLVAILVPPIASFPMLGPELVLKYAISVAMVFVVTAIVAFVPMYLHRRRTGLPWSMR